MKNIEQIRTVTLFGLILNLFLAAVKFTVGIVGASQAVIADAVHSLSDLTTDLAVLVGVKYWSAPPDSCHPYGHQKIESITTVALGLILLITAFGIGFEAIRTITDVQTGKVGIIAITGPVLSLIFKEIMYQYTIKIAKRVRSSALIANAWHHRSDALSSIPALIAVVLANTNPNLTFLDNIGALIIAIFILGVSWNILKPAVRELSDSGSNKQTRESIKEIAFSIYGVKDIHAIRTRKISSNIFADFHLLVSPEISVSAGHEIATKVKNKLMKSSLDIIDVVIHIEPFGEK